MADRIVLGEVNGGDYGLYVSRPGSNIIDGSGNLTTSGQNIMFSSSLGNRGGWNLKYKGEFSLSSPGSGTPTQQTITHNLGYRPLVIVQYSYANELTGGVATLARTPFYFYYNIEDEGLEGFGPGTLLYEFGVTYYTTTSQLVISNFGRYSATGQTDESISQNSNYTGTAYIAYLIFGVS